MKTRAKPFRVLNRKGKIAAHPYFKGGWLLDRDRFSILRGPKRGSLKNPSLKS
jgi:hypothetical protein